MHIKKISEGLPLFDGSLFLLPNQEMTKYFQYEITMANRNSFVMNCFSSRNADSDLYSGSRQHVIKTPLFPCNHINSGFFTGNSGSRCNNTRDSVPSRKSRAAHLRSWNKKPDLNKTTGCPEA